MERLLYDMGIFLYENLIGIASLFHHKAKLFRKGRQNWEEKMPSISEEDVVVWFHCASLGEFEQARPLIEYLKKYHTHLKILLTFFSPSGYEVRKHYALADWILYIPLDKRRNALRFVEKVKPKAVFLAKYEFWYHFLEVLHQKKIPIFSFSAIFRPDQWFFMPHFQLGKKALRYINTFFVQNEESAHLLASIGITKVEITGDTRFDRVCEISAQRKAIPIAETFKNNQKTIVIGSSWAEDLAVITNPLRTYVKEGLKIIIAPHEISEKNILHIESIFLKNDCKTIRFSKAENIPNLSHFDVLLIDNIGMLSSLYFYGDFAYIGGAFGKGLHNILEAAVYGIPVFFGNRYEKFREAVLLLQAGGAFAIHNQNDFKLTFDRMFYNEDLRKEASQVALHFIKNHQGATQKIMQKTEPYLHQ